jgi:hypothetical protein
MSHAPQLAFPSRRGCRLAATVLLLVVACAGSGCAALTNPVAEGVPVRVLPPELLAPPRDEEVCVPAALLGQPTPEVYRLAPGDVLGVWIEGVFPAAGAVAPGAAGTPPPVHLPPPTDFRDQRRLLPAAGYPVAVEEDGTISLPRIPPVPVTGLSVAEAQRAVREAYTVKRDILKAGTEQVLVTLLQPRRIQVTVLRQEHSVFGIAPDGGAVPVSKLGTGQLLDLPAYENDVLHALTLTGGLPGLDAYDEVLIQRRLFPAPGCPLPGPGPVPDVPGVQVVRLPLRQRPGGPAPFWPGDVILHPGDVVLLRARDCDRFYTDGLLPPGEHVLPRDHDLDVLEAIALVRGPMVNGAFNINNLSGNLIAPGLGNPSPSLLTVVRRTPGGGQVPIRVDLTRALVDARERITVQPGDVLILQERPGDALGRYVSETFLNFSLTWQAVHDRFITGVFDVSAPERIPARIGVTNFTNGVTR